MDFVLEADIVLEKPLNVSHRVETVSNGLPRGFPYLARTLSWSLHL